MSHLSEISSAEPMVEVGRGECGESSGELVNSEAEEIVTVVKMRDIAGVVVGVANVVRTGESLWDLRGRHLRFGHQRLFGLCFQYCTFLGTDCSRGYCANVRWYACRGGLSFWTQTTRDAQTIGKLIVKL
jgi:hypothetical protein